MDNRAICGEEGQQNFAVLFIWVSHMEGAYPQGYIIGVLSVDPIEQNGSGCAEMFVLANLSQSYKVVYSELFRYFEPRAEFSVLSRLFFSP